MSATRVPAIPAPTDENLRDVARAVKSVLDVREGLLGDPLDRFVTLRDLVDGGVASSSGGRLSPTTPTATDTGAFETYDPTTDLTIPPAPEGFEATGLFSAVKLGWIAPPIRNYAYTEIWRSNTNALGTAVLIGTSNGTSYLDYLGNGVTRYYWARFVSQANIVGPYNSAEGTPGSASPDPEYLLELLTGEITETQLYQGLGDRIALIDGPSTMPNSVANRILAEALARQAAITTEAQTRQTQDESLAQQITTLTASVASNAAAIQNEATVRATADSAEATERNTLAARVTVTENGVAANAAAISTESTARVSADSAMSALITNLDAVVYNNTVAIQQEATTRATADTANANLISQVQARLDTGDYAAVKTQSSVTASKVGGLEAQYTVKIDVNGHVSGFGLATSTATGTPTSAFIVRADRFALAGASDTTDPLGTINPSRLPFVVSTQPTTINGVSVPAGTYINTAFIGNATIKSAQIGSVYADRIQAGFTSSVDMESSTFYGSELYLGGSVTYEYNDPARPTQKTGIATVSNPNIALRNTGAEFNVNYFKIKNGTITYTPFEVVNGVVNIGVGMIGDGTITNAKIGSFIQSTNYVAGSSGWRISKDGTAEFGAASIRGQLTADQIDSRNLTIKNSDGQVILGAGTALRTSDISGLGAFATLGQINLNNASTYIASGAIGEALIGNAQIGTLKIAGNAVTVPATANAFNLITIDRWPQSVVLQNWQALVTLTVDFGAVAPTAVLVCGIVNVLSQVGARITASYMRIRNQTTGNALVDVGISHGDSIVLTNLGSVSAVSGVNTFILEVSQQDVGGAYYLASSRSLFVMGSKR